MTHEQPAIRAAVPISERLKLWWLNKLDNDSVRAWVPHYNAAWLAWALLSTSLLPPISTLNDAMGPVGYLYWEVFAVVANTLPIIGLAMTHGGSSVANMPIRMATRDWYGLFLQATGHFIACILLVMFEVSVIITVFTYDGPAQFAGMTVFAGFILAPWTEGTALLFAQCMRKVQIALRREREEAS